MPRRPVSPDADAKAGAAAAAGKKDKKGGKKDDANAAESPQPPMDPDERLIFDAYQTATGTLSSIVSTLRVSFLSNKHSKNYFICINL